MQYAKQAIVIAYNVGFLKEYSTATFNVLHTTSKVCQRASYQVQDHRNELSNMAVTCDFRSDTVTKPSKDMMAAMMCAEVGDDVWGDDPTINELQRIAAEMFGHDAALFCPSGTMTNQIAIKVSRKLLLVIASCP